MRTTITLEDALASELKKRVLETGKSFKQVVNETLLPACNGKVTAHGLTA